MARREATRALMHLGPNLRRLASASCRVHRRNGVVAARRSPKASAKLDTVPYRDPKSPAALASLRAARRRHYESNKDAYLERAKARRNELRQYVREQKEANPCVDCGQKHPFYVMQFDHIDDTKVAAVSLLTSHGSMTKLLNELAKCELICANCHAARTYLRLGIETTA